MTRPSRTPVSSASGTDAADVLPWSCTVTITRSIGRSSRLAIAPMMRMLAWCGISQFDRGLLEPVVRERLVDGAAELGDGDLEHFAARHLDADVDLLVAGSMLKPLETPLSTYSRSL